MQDVKNKYERKILDKLPFEVVDLDENLVTHFFKSGEKWVQIGPKKYCMRDRYKKWGLDIYNFEARPDDVFLIGFPRSGTTLHCEMIWQIGNGLDYEGAKDAIIECRFPRIDFRLFPSFDKIGKIAENSDADVDENVKETVKNLAKQSLQDLADMKGRRFIKSHMPISLMPPHIFEVGAKVIYCARNPRDMLVSLYNVTSFLKMDPNFGFKGIVEAHINDLSFNCPYFEHVKEAWTRRNDDNFLFLFYEDTIKDKKQAMEQIANFLGKELSNDQLNSLDDHLSIDKFRNNKSVNSDFLVKLGLANGKSQFIRTGKSGGWREYFDENLEKKVNKWTEENLKDTDLTFPDV